jgi:hypothetical protein
VAGRDLKCGKELVATDFMPAHSRPAPWDGKEFVAMDIVPAPPTPGAFLKVNELILSRHVDVLDALLSDTYNPSAGSSNSDYLARRLVHVVFSNAISRIKIRFRLPSCISVRPNGYWPTNSCLEPTYLNLHRERTKTGNTPGTVAGEHRATC